MESCHNLEDSVEDPSGYSKLESINLQQISELNSWSSSKNGYPLCNVLPYKITYTYSDIILTWLTCAGVVELGIYKKWCVATSIHAALKFLRTLGYTNVLL